MTGTRAITKYGSTWQWRVGSGLVGARHVGHGELPGPTCRGRVGAVERGSAYCAPGHCHDRGLRSCGDPCAPCPCPCLYRGSCCCASCHGPSIGSGCGDAVCDPFHRGCASPCALCGHPPLLPPFRSLLLLLLGGLSPPAAYQAAHTWNGHRRALERRSRGRARARHTTFSQLGNMEQRARSECDCLLVQVCHRSRRGLADVQRVQLAAGAPLKLTCDRRTA